MHARRIALVSGFLLASLTACKSRPEPSRPLAAVPAGLPAFPAGDLRDGRRLIYHVAVASFQDTDGDGYGDLAGLERRLPYLRELGVGMIMLDDVVAGGSADGGRAALDWSAIDSRVGDEAAFASLAASAATFDIAIGVQLGLNQIDEGHTWWQAARASTTAAERAWFRTATAPVPCPDLPNIPLDPYGPVLEDGSDRWIKLDDANYAYHRFASTSPDVRLEHPDVAAAAKAAVAAWMDRGVRAFMLPDVYAWREDADGCDQRAASHELLATWRAAGVFGEAALYGFPRPPVQSPQGDHELTVGWLGDADARELDGTLAGDLTAWLQQAFVDPAARPALRDGIKRHADLRAADGGPGQIVWALGHGETSRLAAVAGDDRSRKLALSLVLSAPFTPWIYYGDELGLGPSAGLSAGDWRALSRAGMIWEAEAPNFGFGEAGPPMPPPIGAERRAVDVQIDDVGSLLRWTRARVADRYRHAALHAGGYADVDARDPSGRVPDDTIAFLRRHAEGGALILHNFADVDQPLAVRLDATGWSAGDRLIDLVAGTEVAAVWAGDPGTLEVTVPRRGSRWIIAER